MCVLFFFYVVTAQVPQHIYDDSSEHLLRWHEDSLELRSARDVADRGYAKYLKSRPGASVESVKRAKKMAKEESTAATAAAAANAGTHPLMTRETSKDEERRNDFLQEMKKFRPKAVSEACRVYIHPFVSLFFMNLALIYSPKTIFEIGNTANSAHVRSVMSGKRSRHEAAIGKKSQRNQEEAGEEEEEWEEANTAPVSVLQESSQVCGTSGMQ